MGVGLNDGKKGLRTGMVGLIGLLVMAFRARSMLGFYMRFEGALLPMVYVVGVAG